MSPYCGDDRTSPVRDIFNRWDNPVTYAAYALALADEKLLAHLVSYDQFKAVLAWVAVDIQRKDRD